MTNSLVDAYLCYISGILQNIMKKRPDVLRSSESLTFKEVLEQGTQAELLEYLIDKKINKLSYGGLNSLEEYVRSVFSIALFPNFEVEEGIKILIEARNINVHNRGFVNRTFLERTKKIDFDKPIIGKRFHLNLDALTKMSKEMVLATVSFDGAVSEKYGVKRKKYSTWQGDRSR